MTKITGTPHLMVQMWRSKSDITISVSIRRSGTYTCTYKDIGIPIFLNWEPIHLFPTADMTEGVYFLEAESSRWAVIVNFDVLLDCMHQNRVPRQYDLEKKLRWLNYTIKLIFLPWHSSCHVLCDTFTYIT